MPPSVLPFQSRGSGRARPLDVEAVRARQGSPLLPSKQWCVQPPPDPVPQASVETLKVSTRSNPNSVAGAMAGVVRSSGSVVVQVVGAGALNQAIKAIAIARGYVAPGGIDLVCIPSFTEVEIDGERRTAIRLRIHDRAGSPAVFRGESLVAAAV